MLRRYESRENKHINENVEQISQHNGKKDTLSTAAATTTTTSNVSSHLLRPKDANQKRRDKDQGAKHEKDSLSTATSPPQSTCLNPNR